MHDYDLEKELNLYESHAGGEQCVWNWSWLYSPKITWSKNNSVTEISAAFIALPQTHSAMTILFNTAIISSVTLVTLESKLGFVCLCMCVTES